MLKSFLLFISLIGIGLIIANTTTPWNDEIYTLQTIRQSSYIDIIQGKLSEGCNEPLFYLIQKPFNSFKLMPIIFKALAITLIFNFFREISWRAGWFSVVLLLSCRITWQHYAEIRPYSLIVLLSTIQCLLFYKNKIKWLPLLNVIMAFTHSIMIVPILFSALKLRGWQLLSVVFSVLIILYYFHVSVYVGNIHNLPGYSNRYFIYLLPWGIIGAVKLLY